MRTSASKADSADWSFVMSRYRNAHSGLCDLMLTCSDALRRRLFGDLRGLNMHSHRHQVLFQHCHECLKGSHFDSGSALGFAWLGQRLKSQQQRRSVALNLLSGSPTSDSCSAGRCLPPAQAVTSNWCTWLHQHLACTWKVPSHNTCSCLNQNVQCFSGAASQSESQTATKR
jgi:hypothetical protein